jgi:hypothetical protein
MRKRTVVVLLLLGLPVIPFALPERARIPVHDASPSDWNGKSFWYEPWGASGVHKGIDIFAPAGRPVVAPVSGLVVSRGRLDLGGNVMVLLGPKSRVWKATPGTQGWKRMFFRGPW